MNKKWLLVVLLAMLALVLTGCGGEKATSAEFFEYIVTPDDTKDTKIKDTAPFFRPIFSEERHQKDTEA